MKSSVVRRALGTLCAAVVLLTGLPVSLLFLPASAEAKNPAYTAEANHPVPAADATISGGSTGAMQVRDTDVIGLQVALTAPALSVSTNVPSYSNASGSATMALFRFNTDYDTSLLSDPIAEHTFVNFADSADLTFRFSEKDPLPAGEYILLLYDMNDPAPGEGNGTGIGLWSCSAHEGQRTYFNGSFVSDRSHPFHVDYVSTPSKLYDIPTKPAVSGDMDYAPLMTAVLDFRDAAAMDFLGGGYQTKATQITANGDTFLHLAADTHANDPYQYINLPDTVIKCSEYKYLLLKLRRSTGSVLQSQVFFTTDEVGISEAASMRPTYADSTDWQYVVVNLGASGSYAGLLKALRLDYYQTCEGRGNQFLDLQYMALFKSEEAARAFHDNFEDFQAPDNPDLPDSTPPETAPDNSYSDYITADPPATPEAGKLCENGQLSYIYKEFLYEMDFTATPEEYMSMGGFGFSGLENALVHNDTLQCKAFSTFTFFTRQVLGDPYGMRGGSLSMDLVLTSGAVIFTARQILPNDDFAYSGLRFELASDGQLTVSDRDGFSDGCALEIDLSTPHRVGLSDTGDTISLSVDGKAVYTLLWDRATQTLRTADPNGPSCQSLHLPNAGYASFRATRTRGYVDNVRYTHTDIVSKTVNATSPVDFSTWSATDDLDRTTPTDVGEANGKQVGLFYFLIHSDSFSGREVNDVTRFYLEGGTEQIQNILSSFAGRDGAYWAEPYFGYYSSHDEWVYRKHAYMLSAAGVDFIFLDVSNNVFYVEQATVLFDTWKSIRDEGGQTPQIAFMYGDMPFTLLNGFYTLLEPFYNNPDYQELLYCVDGKPLLLGNNDVPEGSTWTVSGTTPQSRSDYRTKLRADPALNAFYQNEYQNALLNFTVRKCWAWQAGTYRGYWDWLQESPQALGTNFDGRVEQISVSMGVHAHTNRGRSYVNGDNTYNKDGHFGYTLGTAKYGYFFAEQFEYALRQDVDIVMITGWNEWYAGVQKGEQNQICGQTASPGFFMVDQMSPEYSRDGEPMKLRDGLGFGDNYYYQMASYIRRFKGMKAMPATVNGGNLGAAQTSAWEQVAPAFTDIVGDADLRHALGFSGEFLYTNGTARNDLDTAKVSQDDTHIYFYISTATPLITVDDPYWMNLYIDTDANPATGWEGFDFILNRARTDKHVLVEAFAEDQWFTSVYGEAAYTLGENHMVISVEKKLLGLPEGEVVSLHFKWADNARIENDIMRFMTEGDCAPNDRFVFTYKGSSLTDERPAAGTTDTETAPATPDESTEDAETAPDTSTAPDTAPADESAPDSSSESDVLVESEADAGSETETNRPEKKGCASSFGTAVIWTSASVLLGGMLLRKRRKA